MDMSRRKFFGLSVAAGGAVAAVAIGAEKAVAEMPKVDTPDLHGRVIAEKPKTVMETIYCWPADGTPMVVEWSDHGSHKFQYSEWRELSQFNSWSNANG